MATMAITPTIGSTVARATLPPWLRPEPLLEAGEDCVWAVEDCVWGTATAGGVAAAGTERCSYCCNAWMDEAALTKALGPSESSWQTGS